MARTKKEVTEVTAELVDPGAVALRFNIDATNPTVTVTEDGETIKTPNIYFPGVPCRDLTADEVGVLPEYLRRGLVASGIYSV